MKHTTNELTRLAFLGAEQDARALADAWAHDSSEHREYSDLADQFKAYRMKRWGQTEFETLVKDCRTVSIYELQARGGPDRAFGATPREELEAQSEAEIKTTAEQDDGSTTDLCKTILHRPTS